MNNILVHQNLDLNSCDKEGWTFQLPLKYIHIKNLPYIYETITIQQLIEIE